MIKCTKKIQVTSRIHGIQINHASDMVSVKGKGLEGNSCVRYVLFFDYLVEQIYRIGKQKFENYLPSGSVNFSLYLALLKYYLLMYVATRMAIRDQTQTKYTWIPN